MPFRVAITRPEPHGSETAARLGAMGYETVLAPLLVPSSEDGPGPADGIGSIALTSRFAAKVLAAHPAFHHIPVHAVGDATADEARRAGFDRVSSAAGAVDDLFAMLRTAPEPIVHMAGADQRGDLVERLRARGQDAERRAIYRMIPNAAFPAPSEPVDAALLYSPRSAEVFARLATGPAWRGVTLICMSPSVAAPVSATFPTVVAQAPNQDAMIAALRLAREARTPMVDLQGPAARGGTA
ncbi:uroporphyrinogen-III synthase [Acuticoccus sp. M5D2P5]|uniref:uroporphyrinogen-III synthase n=1 Tax=Acuticoccus kalidii TaxID=2910977 RepID=UPI001F2B2B42|nr:uroporphyrinogen-III synthase [Acuticoccus kalidii]